MQRPQTQFRGQPGVCPWVLVALLLGATLLTGCTPLRTSRERARQPAAQPQAGPPGSEASSNGVPLHPSPRTIHYVASGETVYSIAQRYRTTVARLLELNPGLSPSALRVGQSLVLPGGKARVRAVEHNRATGERW